MLVLSQWHVNTAIVLPGTWVNTGINLVPSIAGFNHAAPVEGPKLFVPHTYIYFDSQEASSQPQTERRIQEGMPACTAPCKTIRAPLKSRGMEGCQVQQIESCWIWYCKHTHHLGGGGHFSETEAGRDRCYIKELGVLCIMHGMACLSQPCPWFFCLVCLYVCEASQGWSPSQRASLSQLLHPVGNSYDRSAD